jgi:hypothetical protein
LASVGDSAIQPLNHLEHATQIIAEATALLELNNTKRAKLPAQSLEAFLNSVITLAKKPREQPSAQKILGKLNSLQPIVEDITLIKNAVNNVTRVTRSSRTQCSHSNRLLSRRSPVRHALIPHNDE